MKCNENTTIYSVGSELYAIHKNSYKVFIVRCDIQHSRNAAFLEILGIWKAISVKTQLNMQSYWNVNLLLKCQIQGRRRYQ